MIPSSYRENENCYNCTDRKRIGVVNYCLFDRSTPPDPMTKDWQDAHVVSEDGTCDEWAGR